MNSTDASGPKTIAVPAVRPPPRRYRERVSERARIRVYLLDDHELIRRGIKDLLEESGEIVVVGESGLAQEAAAQIPALKPDVAILDGCTALLDRSVQLEPFYQQLSGGGFGFFSQAGNADGVVQMHSIHARSTTRRSDPPAPPLQTTDS